MPHSGASRFEDEELAGGGVVGNPQRSCWRLPRQAYADRGRPKRALKELGLERNWIQRPIRGCSGSREAAAQSDQQAVARSGKSQELYGNRGLYRSGLSSTRTGGWCCQSGGIYADAGMRDWSLYAASLAANL